MLPPAIEAIEESNGRKSETLREVAQSALSDVERRFVVDACHAEARKARAASFIVRRQFETKQAAGLDVKRAFDALRRPAHWEVVFQLLQCFRYCPDEALPYLDVVRGRLEDEATALRVVSLDAFVHLSLVDEALRKEARLRVMQALEDEMPSLRARGRHMAKVLEAAE